MTGVCLGRTPPRRKPCRGKIFHCCEWQLCSHASHPRASCFSLEVTLPSLLFSCLYQRTTWLITVVLQASDVTRRCSHTSVDPMTTNHCSPSHLAVILFFFHASLLHGCHLPFVFTCHLTECVPAKIGNRMPVPGQLLLIPCLY